MSESVLVIPSPSSCFDCPLFREGILDTCLPLGRCIHDEEGGFDEDDNDRPSWCPLRPLPQKKEVEVNEIEDIMHTEYSIEDIYTNKYIADIRLATDKLISLGWNACLDEITGETE